MSKFFESKKLWKQQSESATQRDYSFDTVSGEKVDILYYPEGDDNFCQGLEPSLLIMSAPLMTDTSLIGIQI